MSGSVNGLSFILGFANFLTGMYSEVLRKFSQKDVILLECGEICGADFYATSWSLTSINLFISGALDKEKVLLKEENQH